MSNSIVQVNVSQQIAQTPSTLQQTGALISQGATTLAAGTYSLITDIADLTALLVGGKALSALAWASSVVTATTAAPHGYTIGDILQLTLAGNTPAGYNGTFTATITTTTQFTYPLASNPGTATVFGTVTVEDVSELVAMGTTFFAQGNTLSTYVLELGAGNALDGTVALSTFINASPQFFYAYLTPRSWGVSTDFVAFAANYNSTTAKTYFFVTTTTGFYTSFPAVDKSVRTMIEAPTIPTTEFSIASWFYTELNKLPSATNLSSPSAFKFLTGVTPYPTLNNSALLATLKTAGVNVVGTGAEGGISNTILLWGTGMDLNDASYWYSVDWVQINVNLDVSNAVINGSNNPLNPLYFDQNGINRLQAVAQGTMTRGISFGLINSSVATIVSAIPFLLYVTQNPGDYKIGRYSGLAVSYVPARGFIQIIFNVLVSQFPVA
jgi:hypothetical protein